MIISRRKYERDLQEAAAKAYDKAQQEYWQREEIRGLQSQIDDLKARVRKLEPAPEFVYPDTVTAVRPA